MTLSIGSLMRGGAAAAAMALALIGTPQSAHADSEPFIGEMMQFGGNFCPRGWARADGTLIAINQNTALFSLIGTIYGGDGRTTFALPDLRGRAPVHSGSGPGLPTVREGEKGGATSFTLNAATMPAHGHTASAVLHAHEEAGNADAPGDALHAGASSEVYSTQTADTTMGTAANPAVTATLTATGSSQSVTKRSPMLGQMWCIALVGIFPSRS